MVLDTACQKACHGPLFSLAYNRPLESSQPQAFAQQSYEPLRFGISRTVSALTEVWPAMVGAIPFIVILQLVAADDQLPFLGSLAMFYQLGVMLDARARTAQFTAL
eukprot:45807-Alexandrium_andersonii.AAC.1